MEAAGPKDCTYPVVAFDTAGHDGLMYFGVGWQFLTWHRLGQDHHRGIFVALILEASYPVVTLRAFEIFENGFATRRTLREGDYMTNDGL